MLLKWPSPQHLPVLKTKTVTARSEPASPPRQSAHAGRSGALVWSAQRFKVLNSLAAFHDGSFHLTMETSGFSWKTGRSGDAGSTFLM